MSSPYINTTLYTNLILNPEQFGNAVYKNLKGNLVAKLEGKCYKDYGLITKIFEIQKYENGIIQPENPTAGALYDIKFSCRLCIPLKKKQLICEVDRMNELLVGLKNGPIIVIVATNWINKNVFIIDQNRNIRYKEKDEYHILKAGSLVKVTITSTTFNDMDNCISVLGELDSMASDTEIKSYYNDIYDQGSGNIIDYDKFLAKTASDQDETKDLNLDNDEDEEVKDSEIETSEPDVTSEEPKTKKKAKVVDDETEDKIKSRKTSRIKK